MRSCLTQMAFELPSLPKTPKKKIGLYKLKMSKNFSRISWSLGKLAEVYSVWSSETLSRLRFFSLQFYFSEKTLVLKPSKINIASHPQICFQWDSWITQYGLSKETVKNVGLQHWKLTIHGGFFSRNLLKV